MNFHLVSLQFQWSRTSVLVLYGMHRWTQLKLPGMRGNQITNNCSIWQRLNATWVQYLQTTCKHHIWVGAIPCNKKRGTVDSREQRTVVNKLLRCIISISLLTTKGKKKERKLMYWNWPPHYQILDCYNHSSEDTPGAK